MTIKQDVYFSTEFKKTYEYNYNFNIPLDVNIDVKNNDKIKLKLIDFSMINAMLNISSYHKNNTFKVRYNSIDYLITIADGSYTASSLKDYINGYLSAINIPLIFNYNKSTNKYTLETSSSVIFYPLNCAFIFGFANSSYTITSPTKLITETFVNMLPYTKIIIACNLSFECNTQNNFERRYSSNTGIGNIICWFPRDIPIFSTINYINNTNDEIEIADKNIKSINIMLINEYNEFILDAPISFLHLQLIIYDNTNWFKKFYNIINDIAYYLLSSYFKK